MTKIGRHNPLTRVGRAIAAALGAEGRPVPTPAGHPPWVIAHRGGARVAPENTIEAFSTAMDQGADGVEADVCVTRDGHFVVWHDADPGDEIALARQAGREELAFTPDVPALGSRWRRAVADLTLVELRRHYGYCRRRGGISDLIADDRPPGILVATLSELLAWADREWRLRHVCLDVKLSGNQSGEAVRLLELLRDRVTRPDARADLRFHYLTPHREIVEPLAAQVAARPLPERLVLHADFELPGVLETARRLGLRDVSMGAGQRFWNEFRREVGEVVAAREAGEIESVIVWTVNQAERLRQMVALGVDGILTDDAPTLREIVGSEAPSDAVEGV